jgi:VanZ family protein
MQQQPAGGGNGPLARHAVWWTLWVLFAVAWTAGLLSAAPIQVRNEVMAEQFHVSVGKSLHLAAYGVFVYLSGRLPPRRLLLALVVLHAPLTEYLQQFVGRTASVLDVLVDWLGVAVGVILTRSRWTTGGNTNADDTDQNGSKAN